MKRNIIIVVLTITVVVLGAMLYNSEKELKEKTANLNIMNNIYAETKEFGSMAYSILYDKDVVEVGKHNFPTRSICDDHRCINFDSNGSLWATEF